MDHAIVLFDGECNLCSGSVRFMIANDPADRFRFAPSQSAAGRELFARYGLPETGPGSIVVIDERGVHQRSDAAITIARGLRMPWPLFAVAERLPRAWRDAAYDLVARNRKRFFGARASCDLSTPATAARFL